MKILSIVITQAHFDNRRKMQMNKRKIRVAVPGRQQPVLMTPAHLNTTCLVLGNLGANERKH